MMNKKQIRELAKRSSIKGIRLYMQRVHEEVDVISGEEKRMILEEMESIIGDIREDKAETYKRKYENAERRLEHLASLDDCDEEFEM